MDLASMLQGQGGGAPPQGGPGPMPMASPQGGPMPPQQAIQVLQRFGITERDVPMVAQAIMALMSGGGAPQGGPPPSMPPQMG